MRIRVKRHGANWVVYESGIVPLHIALRQRIQFFPTWAEAITEAIYRSERIKTCKQS